jgi:hypothetical protein
MRPYFTRERFGRPQFLAGLLLLAFLAQALWLVHAELHAAHEPDGSEALRIGEGWKQWHGHGIAAAPTLDAMSNAVRTLYRNGDNEKDSGFDTERSPLLYLVSSAPLLAWPKDLDSESAPYWRWLPRLPFLACGLFLGASLWYVARRLCGNTGGFVALTFYCFSPSLIQASAVWHTEPEIAAAWGSFGTIFTAIAVAHTLYAPREVVLWNWRRIAIFPDHPRPPGARVPALRCTRTPPGRPRDLDCGLRRGIPPALRRLLFPAARLRREHAPC